MSQLDNYEAEVLAAYENAPIKPNGASKAELEKYRLAAAATFANKKQGIFQRNHKDDQASSHIQS